MDNIIIVEENNKYCFKNIKEVVKKFLGDDFYNLSDEEKYEKIRLKTAMNAILKNIPIKDLKKGEKIENIKDEQYIVYDEETFILSLIKNNDIVVYEKEVANMFVKNIDKTDLKKIEKEYIIVNYCINELLENKLKNSKFGENNE